MKTSPLRLDDAFVCHIELKSYPQGTSSVKHSDVRVEAQPTYSRFVNDPTKWKVELEVIFNGSEEQPVPYEGRVCCKGFFTWMDESMPQERQRKAVAVNCASILYATAREAVAFLTGRGEHGMMLLPSISFIDNMISPPEGEEPEPTLEEEPEAESEPEADFNPLPDTSVTEPEAAASNDAPKE
jgi:preprotein translocase subunit SecB